MHSTQGIAPLLKKYLENRITKDELILLENWRKQDSKNEKFFYEITENDQIYEDTLTWLELQQHQDEHWLEGIKVQYPMLSTELNVTIRTITQPYIQPNR